MIGEKRIWSGARRLLLAALVTAAAAILLVASSRPARAQSSCLAPWPTVNLVEVEDSFTLPLGIVNAGDGSDRLFIVGKQGEVWIIKNGLPLATPFLDISDRVANCAECGLLGLAFPANYADEGYFFVSYTANTNRVPGLPGEPNPTPGNDNVIARYRVSANPDVALTTEEVVLEINQPYTNHNGGQIVFGPDGYLYVGIGDGGGGGDPLNRSQNLDSLLGKMLRIAVSGAGAYTIPPDNPFVGATPGRDEIWASGLRNPWRFSFDAASGNLWIADVGQGDWEEINLEPAGHPGGLNYGWRIMEGAHCFKPSSGCDSTGLTLPVWEYDHNEGSSITGGAVYRGAEWPAMTATYIFADYDSGTIWGLRPTSGGWASRELLSTGYSIATFGEDEAGELYLADLYAGAIYKFEAGGTESGLCTWLPLARRLTDQ